MCASELPGHKIQISYTCIYSYCDFMCAVALSFTANTVLLYMSSTSGSYSLSVSSAVIIS